MSFGDPVGTQRKRQEEKMNSSGPHTVSLGKIPSALPLLGEASATADSPGLSGSVERIDFTRPNGEQQGRTYYAHRFDTPVHFRIPTNPVFERMVWTQANENSKPAHLPMREKPVALGRFETVPKESVKVDQHCQEFSPLIKSRVIWFAISSEQSF